MIGNGVGGSCNDAEAASCRHLGWSVSSSSLGTRVCQAVVAISNTATTWLGYY